MIAIARWTPSLLCLLLLSGCTESTYGGGNRTGNGGTQSRTTPEWEQARHAQVLPGHVRVVIDRFELETMDQDAFDLALRYRDENIDVSAGGLGGRNGITIAATRGGFSAALRYDQQHSRTRTMTQQFLLLMAGGEASFEVLHVEPVPRTVAFPIYGGVAIVRTVETQVTGSGMAVRVLSSTPQQVDVELTPYFHGARRGESVVLTELRTRLTLIPGVPYVIAGNRQDTNNFASAFLSFRSQRGYGEVIHVLTVERGE